MNRVYCTKDSSLTDEEKRVFSGHLERQGLSDNIWDLFGEWVARSSPRVSFFYLKAYLDTELGPQERLDGQEAGAQLVGLALFLRMKPFDLPIPGSERTRFSRHSLEPCRHSATTASTYPFAI